MICKNCGNDFAPKNYRNNTFCSSSCSATFNNTKRIRNHPVKNCSLVSCNKEFRPKGYNSKFCSSECSGKSQRLEKIKRFEAGLLKDYSVRSSSIREYVLSKQNGVCAICGGLPHHFGKKLVFIVDHIDGNWKNNAPSNIRCICPNCNSQTDTFGGKNFGSGARPGDNRKTRERK